MNAQSDQFSLDMYLLISELNTKIMRIISNCLGKTTRKKQAKKSKFGRLCKRLDAFHSKAIE